MKRLTRYSLRTAMVAVTVLSIGLGWLSFLLRAKQAERDAMAHLESRSHSALAQGKKCGWPWSVVLGEDFCQHVREVQAWNFKADSVACLADLPQLELVHIKEDELFRSGELTADSFRSLRNHGRIKDLYIEADWDDSILSHFQAPHLERLVLKHSKVCGPGLRSVRPNRLQILTLYSLPIDDYGLQPISRFTQLRHLLIYDAPVSDAGLRCLADLGNLETVVLLGLPITDAGLKWLPRSIERLFVGRIPITDEGINHLEGIPLKQLHLLDTEVTSAGIEQLLRLQPECAYRLESGYKQVVAPTAPALSYDSVFLAYPGVGGMCGDISTVVHRQHNSYPDERPKWTSVKY